MKKSFALLLMCMVLLTACSSNSGSKNNGNTAEPGNAAAVENGGGDTAQAKEITIWAWDPAFNIAALEVARDEYAKTRPEVKVNIVEYAQNDIIQKMNTGLNSGTTKGLPNIVLIEDYRSQGFLQSYKDSFYDLSSYIQGSDFADYKSGPTSLDGKQYGVPFDSGVTGLYFRTDYLEQAGYKLSDLQDIDWKQYIEIGKAVKEKTGKALFSLDPNDLGMVRMMIQSAGSWYLAEDGKTPDIAGNAALKEAFEIYKELTEANVAKVNADWSQYVASLNSGEIASTATGNWITPSITAEPSQAGSWGIAPLPKLPNTKSVHASNLGGSSWYVMNVDGRETAADFMAQTFGSNVEMYQKLLTDIGVIGTLKAAASGEAYSQANEFFGGQKVVSDFSSWTEQIPSVNYGINTYAIEDILVVEMQNYLNGKDIGKVLGDAQAQAESQLK
ncbi:ABC transporter substrate-binding protein [Paenibacillus sp. S150]|uniref:ABC transporter substrate-binding protein n=1 Tax=Paenibacillus sp. S150 TaxID=2749826 RepID=UPI001C598B18|nr:extracellular solute-binding protein [Paenibacillus sp. S150]MBW4083088.1 extracellular solute-binding protein [Paenibacillus sp. S150]